jgi:hypothetical protein
MRKFLNDWIYFCGIGMFVSLGWWLLEIMTGSIHPNKVDNVVACILTLSVYGNLKSWNKSK